MPDPTQLNNGTLLVQEMTPEGRFLDAAPLCGPQVISRKFHLCSVPGGCRFQRPTATPSVLFVVPLKQKIVAELPGTLQAKVVLFIDEANQGIPVFSPAGGGGSVLTSALSLQRRRNN